MAKWILNSSKTLQKALFQGNIFKFAPFLNLPPPSPPPDNLEDTDPLHEGLLGSQTVHQVPDISGTTDA